MCSWLFFNYNNLKQDKRWKFWRWQKWKFCTHCYVSRNNIVIVTFYPNSYSQFENAEAPDFDKIASASSSFSTLSLPSLLPLPTSFIKVLPLPQKINRFLRFASSFGFHIPGTKECFLLYTFLLFYVFSRILYDCTTDKLNSKLF